MNTWRATCGGCGWPILWAWHVTVSGQQCRNCQPQLPPARSTLPVYDLIGWTGRFLRRWGW